MTNYTDLMRNVRRDILEREVNCAAHLHVDFVNPVNLYKVMRDISAKLDWDKSRADFDALTAALGEYIIDIQQQVCLALIKEKESRDG